MSKTQGELVKYEGSDALVKVEAPNTILSLEGKTYMCNPGPMSKLNWFEHLWLEQRFKCRHTNLNKVVAELCRKEFSNKVPVSLQMKAEDLIKDEQDNEASLISQKVKFKDRSTQECSLPRDSNNRLVIKKPKSAYNFYFAEVSKKLKDNLAFKDIPKKVGKMWRELDPSLKK